MVTPTNLWEYYNQKGQSLPSLTERTKLYSDFGLGTGYTGTAQQNTALLGKLLTPSPQDQIAKLQQELVRKQDILTRANQAGITGSMEIPQSILEGTGTSFKLPDTPTTEPNQSGTGAKIASYQTAIDDLQKKLDKMQTDYEAKTKAAETPQTPTSIWQKMMGTTPTPPEWVTNPNWLTEQKTKLWESTGMKSEEYFSQFKSDLAEVTTLKEDYNKAVEAKNQALLREEQRLAPEAVIAGKMSRVEKEANLRLSTMSAQINTKLGIMEMKRGNFTDAQNFVNNAVNDYLTQYKMNVDNFRTFYNVNKDMVDSLKSDYKDIFNKSWDLAKLKLTQEENRTKQIANWIKEVPNANWGSNPLDLTLEDAAQIYRKAVPTNQWTDPYFDPQLNMWVKRNTKTNSIVPIYTTAPIYGTPGTLPPGQTTPQTTALNSAINAVLNQPGMNLSIQERNSLTTELNNLITSGNIEGAKERIRDLAFRGMGTEAYSQYSAGNKTVASLSRINELMDEYVKAGGSTNILVGAWDDILNKLGTGINPKLAYIENSIRPALYALRKSVTGVQFSVMESNDYKTLFPNKATSMKFNIAKSQSLADMIQIQNDELLKQTIGSSAYNSLYGTSFYSQSGNELTQPDGTVWKQNADGSYTRIK